MKDMSFAECPACKREGASVARPKKEVLCKDCRELVEDGRRYRALVLREKSLAKILLPELGRCHDLPYLGFIGDTETRDALQMAFLALLHAATHPGPRNIRTWGDPDNPKEILGAKLFGDGFGSYSGEPAICPRVLVKPLRDVYRAMDAALQSSHAAGELSGRNLLAGLASGTISVDELNEREADLARECQAGRKGTKRDR